MHNKMQFLLAGRRDMHLIAFFPEALVGIHDLQGLGSISRQNQNLRNGHGAPPEISSLMYGCDTDNGKSDSIFPNRRTAKDAKGYLRGRLSSQYRRKTVSRAFRNQAATS